jgi:hypothetical protein
VPHLDIDTLTGLANALPADGELPYADRRAIHAQLADDALLLLEIMCAERVLPIWRSRMPDDNTPVELALAARTSSSGQELKPRIREVHTQLDNLDLRGPEFGAAVAAGLAYWAVARNLVFGRPEEPDDVDGETDLDPDDWSPCFYAAIAEAKPVWAEDGDPEKRREFWRWYLLEAVPAASGQ